MFLRKRKSGVVCFSSRAHYLFLTIWSIVSVLSWFCKRSMFSYLECQKRKVMIWMILFHLFLFVTYYDSVLIYHVFVSKNLNDLYLQCCHFNEVQLPTDNSKFLWRFYQLKLSNRFIKWNTVPRNWFYSLIIFCLLVE